MRRTILAAGLAIALAWAGSAAADTVTSQTNPVLRVNYSGVFASCSVSFIAVVTNTDGSPNLMDAARGSFAFTHFRGTQFALTMKLGMVHRDSEGAPLQFARPVLISPMRDGRPVGGDGRALPSTDEPDYGIIGFAVTDPDIVALLQELDRSGRITFGFASQPGDPLRIVNLDISARQDHMDEGAREAWRSCIADLLRANGIAAPVRPAGG